MQSLPVNATSSVVEYNLAGINPVPYYFAPFRFFHALVCGNGTGSCRNPANLKKEWSVHMSEGEDWCHSAALNIFAMWWCQSTELILVHQQLPGT